MRAGPLFAASAVVLTDGVTKSLAAAMLPATPVMLTPWIGLVHYRNDGLFLGTSSFAVVAPLYWIVLPVAIFWLLRRAVTTRSAAVRWSFALAAGGAAGNLLSRLGGGVVDYLTFPVSSDGMWLIFNLADLALVAGGLLATSVFVAGKLRAAKSSASIP